MTNLRLSHRLRGLLTSLLIAVMAHLPSATAAATEDVASFYSGKTVTVYVGFSPGGGYDSYARLAAEYLGRYIPGNPAVIVENMPGGGGRRAVQYLYGVAPQDGTAISLILQSVGMDSAAGLIPGDIDARNFRAVGRMATETNVGIAWHTSGIQTFEDTQKQSPAFGSTGAGSASYFVPKILNELEGTQYNIIQGYKGGSAVKLAMESGEVDMMMGALSTIRSNNPEWLKDGTVSVVWQLSNTPDPEYPDVVTIGRLGDTLDEKAMYRLIAGSSDIGRALFATPNVPEDRLNALRQAFDAMVKDPEYIQASAQRNLFLEPMSGAELQQVLEDQLQAPAGAIEMLKGYLSN